MEGAIQWLPPERERARSLNAPARSEVFATSKLSRCAIHPSDKMKGVGWWRGLGWREEGRKQVPQHSLQKMAQQAIRVNVTFDLSPL